MLIATGEIAIPPEHPILHRSTYWFLVLQRQGWETICEKIINALGETAEFDLWQMSLRELREKVLHIEPESRSLAKIFDEINRAYALRHFPKACKWGHKTVLHTLYLPWIQPLFPKARYVHLLRDGRDAIASYVSSTSVSLAEATARWKAAVERAWRLGREVGRDRFMEVRYEEFVNNPEKVLPSIASFVGIAYSDVMLDFWETREAVNYSRIDYHRNLTKRVFESSVGKWKERLTVDQQNYVVDRIGKTLHRAGYI